MPAMRTTTVFFRNLASAFRSERARTISKAAASFGRDRDGNVAMLFALSLVPLMFLIGMGMDFSSAVEKRNSLNAAADAAALAAVTPAMMSQSVQAATAVAQNMFTAQASAVRGLQSSPPVDVVVTDNGLNRTVAVSYTAASVNSFASVLGENNWSISGHSQASGSVPPNINFYLLLDNSPSMAIAATTSGINAMVAANSAAQGGCAFACHESDPSADNLGNPGGVDNYSSRRISAW